MNIISKIINFLKSLYIAFLSAIPTELGIILRYWGYKPLFKKTKGKFRIGSGVTIVGFKKIELGNNIRFEKNSYVYAVNANIKLGDNFFLGNNAQLCASRADISIGNDCMIAPNCIIVSDNHRFDDIKTLIRGQGYDSECIVLKNDIWVASNSVVLKGVTIEEGCVIAAGSIVNKNIKKFSVVGGVPIKLIKKRK